tara:strand:- start:640 stop:870 length:231 start_codon:yes stop_codon:yes gene_type:complete
MKIKLLASKECANYFEGNCIVAGKKCWVSEDRCGYFERAVIPGINREDHPNYNIYKIGIKKYRDSIQYANEDQHEE